jgi:isoaspartyl peptidase/L-asparaginase-like protein (Ntn-hydrolase superfamily)
MGAGSAAALTLLDAGAARAAVPSTAGGPVFINTWSDSFSCVTTAARVMHGGGSLMDALEKAVNTIEDDPAIQSVGYGGLPNADGIVELDAAIMDGTSRRAGSVCNLHEIKNPISVARKVMEKTHHTTLAGEGALQFAIEMGFERTQLLTPQSLAAWMKWKSDPHRQTYWLSGARPQRAPNHDTVGLLGYDGRGHVAAGCSTSGLAFKIPGRVADSPLVGCGLYADDNAGAAAATGDGDVMTNYCTSFFIVMLMARGRSAQDACEACLRHMAKSDPRSKEIQAAVIAIDKHGRTGAASMRAADRFQYGVWRDGASQLHVAKAMY